MMGRPRYFDRDQLREYTHTLYFTKAEFYRVKQFVEERGEKLSVFARRTVLEKVEKEKEAQP